MRRFSLSLCLLLIMALAQQVFSQAPQRMTLVEGATGTWCTFCPGSALAMNELLTNGHNVAIVHYHDAGSDPFIIPASQARVNYYGVNTFPTSYFDGENPFVGGNVSTSIYGSYSPLVNAATAIAPLFDIGLSWTQNGSSVDITVEIDEIGTYSGSQPVVHLVATESNIQHYWLGLNEVNNVTRAMLPNQNGNPLMLTNGSATLTYTLPIDSGWDQSKMELVAWVQDPATRVVHQAAKTPLLAPSGQFDPGVVNIPNAPSDISCINSIAPEVTLQNFGADDLASVSFSYNVTNGFGGISSGNHNWVGNLPFGAQRKVTLPLLNFSPGGNNVLTIEITGATDVNGNNVTDVIANNNTQTTSWEYNRSAGDYSFSLTTDDYGYETYWQLVNGTGTVIASGGNTNIGPNGGGLQQATPTDPGAYADNSTITETFSLAGGSCYELLVVDDYNDGFCCSYGNGAYTLTDPNGLVVKAGGQFGATDRTDWFVGSPLGSVDEQLAAEVDIYPNPNQGQFQVRIPKRLLSQSTLSIHGLDGRLVFQSGLKQIETNIQLNNLPAGIYIAKIAGKGGVVIKKLTLY